MKPKLKKKEIIRIAGWSGLLVAVYMLTLDNSRGFIPLIIGLILLLWGYSR